MTEEQFLALLEQVNKNTQAIEELKEAFQTLSTPSPTTLTDALQQQIADLTAVQTQTSADLDKVADRTTILEDKVATLEQKSSGPQMELVGTTLNITLPANVEDTTTTEEAAAAEETTEST